TGALLLFQIANQTIVEFGKAPVHTLSQSTLTLDFLQPLLRGGGRAVTLEPLTQVERNLLYEGRDYAHFQAAFFAYIAAGIDFGRGTLVTPSALARTILPATTVSGGGVTTRAQVAAGAAGRLSPILPPTPVSEGYLSAVLKGGLALVQRKNVAALE